jgi:hypothetical protein
LASIDVGTVLDPADVEHSVILECAERDALIAAAGYAPSFELESQRLG